MPFVQKAKKLVKALPLRVKGRCPSEVPLTNQARRIARAPQTLGSEALAQTIDALAAWTRDLRPDLVLGADLLFLLTRHLEKLGATCGRYIENMYGVRSDALNKDTTTDRLIAKVMVLADRKPLDSVGAGIGYQLKDFLYPTGGTDAGAVHVYVGHYWTKGEQGPRNKEWRVGLSFNIDTLVGWVKPASK